MTPVDGAASPEAAPTGSDGFITLNFAIEHPGHYAILAHLDCPSWEADSVWVQLDDETFYKRDGLGTTGWGWQTLKSYDLTAGDHTLKIGYREPGLKLDQIRLSTIPFAPEPNL